MMNNVISRRFLAECTLFFNGHADDAYNSDCYKPVPFLDENRAGGDYVLIDVSNGQ